MAQVIPFSDPGSSILLAYINTKMRKDKNTANTSEHQLPALKVVDTSIDQSHLELEIDRHVKSIRSLIQRLRPLERQRYYDGLLSHILSQPVEYPFPAGKRNDYDYCNLSMNELSLIRELSVKIHDLYRITEDDNN